MSYVKSFFGMVASVVAMVVGFFGPIFSECAKAIEAPDFYPPDGRLAARAVAFIARAMKHPAWSAGQFDGGRCST